MPRKLASGGKVTTRHTEPPGGGSSVCGSPSGSRTEFSPIGVRSVSYLPLTYDHRLIDGADAGRFVTTVKRRLEEGAFEADLGL